MDVSCPDLQELLTFALKPFFLLGSVHSCFLHVLPSLHTGAPVGAVQGRAPPTKPVLMLSCSVCNVLWYCFLAFGVRSSVMTPFVALQLFNCVSRNHELGVFWRISTHWRSNPPEFLASLLLHNRRKISLFFFLNFTKVEHSKKKKTKQTNKKLSKSQNLCFAASATAD